MYGDPAVRTDLVAARNAAVKNPCRQRSDPGWGLYSADAGGANTASDDAAQIPDPFIAGDCNRLQTPANGGFCGIAVCSERSHRILSDRISDSIARVSQG